MEEVWVYGISEPQHFNKELEWNNTKKVAQEVSLEFHPNYKLFKTQSSYVLCDTNDLYVAHCQYKPVNLNNKAGIAIVDGFSKERNAYRMLFYAILATKQKDFILSDVSMSTQAYKSWIKTLNDSSFKPFATKGNIVIEYKEDEAFGHKDDRSKYDIRVGVTLATETMKILESLQEKITENINLNNTRKVMQILSET